MRSKAALRSRTGLGTLVLGNEPKMLVIASDSREGGLESGGKIGPELPSSIL